MLNRIARPALAVAALTLASTGTLAQIASPSRAEVKAETRAAEKAGQLAPAGEGSPRSYAPPTASMRTRAERKAETLQAREAGELHRAGPEPEWKAARAIARMPSTMTRAERKASTLAAAKSGRLIPSGERADAPRK
jgi:hypothetical protein